MRRHLAVLPLVAIGALAPLVVSSTAFPDYTSSVDEVVYVSQAKALAEGELTLPRSSHEPNFVPALSGRSDDRIVFKYQPAWPAFLALVERLTGSYRSALAAAGAAAVLAMYAFAYELFRRRRLALLAAAAFIGSPFVLVQSGTHLAYLPTVTLLLAGTACVFRGLRTRRGPPFLAAGAILGLAFFHRSFDTALWALPLLGYIAVRGSSVRDTLRRLGLMTAGALPFVALYLVYNAVVTGDPFTPAFRVGASLDTFGFGPRSSFDIPGRPPSGRNFVPGDALHALVALAAVVPDWTFGWFLGAGLAVAAVVFHRREATTWLLVGLGLVFPLGYFFWWGVAHGVRYGLHKWLGPMYWIPLWGPLAVLIALGIEAVALRAPARLGHALRTTRVAPVGAVAALIVLTVVPVSHMWPRVERSGDFRSGFIGAADAPVDGRTLVLLQPNYRGEPYVPDVVPADLEGPDRLVGLAVPGSRPELLGRMVDRRVFELRNRRRPEGLFRPAESVMIELHLERTDRFVIPLDVVAVEDSDRVVATVGLGDRTRSVELGPMTEGERRKVRFTVVGKGDAVGPNEIAWSQDGDGTIHAGATFGRKATDVYELRWEARRSDGRLEVVAPATPFHRYRFAGGRLTWTEEDVAPVLPLA